MQDNFRGIKKIDIIESSPPRFHVESPKPAFLILLVEWQDFSEAHPRDNQLWIYET